jgi:cytochrome oxidase Cu insertion factor (SCO1/SenC/PrrC family)
MPRRSTVAFAAAVLAIAAALAGYALLARQMAGGDASGSALIGGPFALTDQDGRRVTEKDFLGKYMLVFFGYTYCPDVCPTELQVMAAALDTMKADAARITPVFVTIDPARDTVAVVKSYVENFGTHMVGLTGTPEEIAAIAKAYRVYYAKAPGAAGADYLMDHSSIIYLMGPDGRFVKHFTYTTDAAALARDLKEAITTAH